NAVTKWSRSAADAESQCSARIARDPRRMSKRGKISVSTSIAIASRSFSSSARLVAIVVASSAAAPPTISLPANVCAVKGCAAAASVASNSARDKSVTGDRVARVAARLGPAEAIPVAVQADRAHELAEARVPAQLAGFAREDELDVEARPIIDEAKPGVDGALGFVEVEPRAEQIFRRNVARLLGARERLDGLRPALGMRQRLEQRVDPSRRPCEHRLHADQ